VTRAVVVVGSVNVDLVLTADRLPGPGETVGGAGFQQGGGGKGGNQAVAAARLGVPTRLIACVGDDPFGVVAIDELGAAGVDVIAVSTVAAATGVAAVLVDAAGENSIVVAPGANTMLTPGLVATGLDRVGAESVVLLTNLEAPLEAVRQAIATARSRGWTVVLNPAPALHLPRDVLGGVDVLTPNQHEVAGLGFAGVADLLGAGAGAVVVTRGAAGADLHRPGAAVRHVDAIAVDVIDSTGAGDCFSGVLAAALASGADLDVAVEVATIAGSLATARLGARAGFPTMAELRRAAPVTTSAVPAWA
jgi:ribokinase